jgi:hypothetical protein
VVQLQVLDSSPLQQLALALHPRALELLVVVVVGRWVVVR